MIFLRMVLGLTLFGAGTAEAGFLLSPELHWRAFSFNQKDSAVTPNYYGIGGAINIGYSFAEQVDIGAYGDYTPATLTNVEPGKSDALLASYGGRFGLRLAGSVVLAVRVGSQLFNVMSRRKPETEVDGRWSGRFVGGSIGGMFAVTPETAWQVSLDATRADMNREDDASDSARKLDSFSVSLAFVFNSKAPRSNGLGSFIRSLGY